MPGVLFEVVGRSRTERVVKGEKETVYKVTLKSTDSRHRLVLSDKDPALIQRYPLGSEVLVTVGKNPQTTLPKEA